MGFLEIKCFNCEGTFEVHSGCVSKLIEGAAVIRCPHCLAQMDRRHSKKVADAFFIMEEVNKGLRSVHLDQGKPLFQANFKTHYVAPEKIFYYET